MWHGPVARARVRGHRAMRGGAGPRPTARVGPEHGARGRCRERQGAGRNPLGSDKAMPQPSIPTLPYYSAKLVSTSTPRFRQAAVLWHCVHRQRTCAASHSWGHAGSGWGRRRGRRGPEHGGAGAAVEHGRHGQAKQAWQGSQTGRGARELRCCWPLATGGGCAVQQRT